MYAQSLLATRFSTDRLACVGRSHTIRERAYFFHFRLGALPLY